MRFAGVSSHCGVGFDDTRNVSSHQHRIKVGKEQRAFSAAHPRLKPVSGERIAPIRCTRLATLAFIEPFLAGKVDV
jgi:hypothetical protein